VTTKDKRTQRPRDPFERAGHTLDEAARRLEQETDRLLTYLNDEVVPEVRKHSSRGLRKASEELAKFAEYLESTQKPR
jgi:hypothetical protein